MQRKKPGWSAAASLLPTPRLRLPTKRYFLSLSLSLSILRNRPVKEQKQTTAVPDERAGIVLMYLATKITPESRYCELTFFAEACLLKAMMDPKFWTHTHSGSTRLRNESDGAGGRETRAQRAHRPRGDSCGLPEFLFTWSSVIKNLGDQPQRRLWEWSAQTDTSVLRIHLLPCHILYSLLHSLSYPRSGPWWRLLLIYTSMTQDDKELTKSLRLLFTTEILWWRMSHSFKRAVGMLRLTGHGWRERVRRWRAVGIIHVHVDGTRITIGASDARLALTWLFLVAPLQEPPSEEFGERRAFWLGHATCKRRTHTSLHTPAHTWPCAHAHACAISLFKTDTQDRREGQPELDVWTSKAWSIGRHFGRRRVRAYMQTHTCARAQWQDRAVQWTVDSQQGISRIKIRQDHLSLTLQRRVPTTFLMFTDGDEAGGCEWNIQLSDDRRHRDMMLMTCESCWAQTLNLSLHCHVFRRGSPKEAQPFITTRNEDLLSDRKRMLFVLYLVSSEMFVHLLHLVEQKMRQATLLDPLRIKLKKTAM